RADAEHDGAALPELAPGVADPARLLRATGCVVLRIEVEDDRLPAQVREPNGLAGVRRDLEVGCRLAFLDYHCRVPCARESARSARLHCPSRSADVAELVDAHGSGPCGGNPVEVQILSSALSDPSGTTQVSSGAAAR